MKTILVYITYPTQKEAGKAGEMLLEKSLIACANVVSSQSFYYWKGKIENIREYVLVGKTQERNYKKIVEEVEKNHSYDFPCIGKLPVSFNAKYGNWVKTELRRKQLKK